MKKLSFLIFILIAKSAFAQKDTVHLNIPMTDGAIIYQRVFSVPGMSTAALYNNALLWFIEHYKSTRDIQTADPDFGRVVGKGIEVSTFKGPLNIDVPYNLNITIQIDCKDGRFRCRIFNITMDDQGQGKDKLITIPEDLMNQLLGKRSGTGFNNNQAQRALESLNTAINNTMLSLNRTMNEKNDF